MVGRLCWWEGHARRCHCLAAVRVLLRLLLGLGAGVGVLAGLSGAAGYAFQGDWSGCICLRVSEEVVLAVEDDSWLLWWWWWRLLLLVVGRLAWGLRDGAALEVMDVAQWGREVLRWRWVRFDGLEVWRSHALVVEIGGKVGVGGRGMWIESLV